MIAGLIEVRDAFNAAASRVAVATFAATRGLPCGLELDLALTVIDRTGLACRVVRRCSLGADLEATARIMAKDFAAARG